MATSRTQVRGLQPVASDKFAFKFASLYGLELFTDTTITLKNGVVLNAHKVVIALNSGYFQIALGAHLMLAEPFDTNALIFEDDSPVAVTALIQFLYLGHYDYPPAACSDGYFGRHLLDFELAVLAEKYDVEHLPAVASDRSSMNVKFHAPPGRNEFWQLVKGAYGIESKLRRRWRAPLIRWAVKRPGDYILGPDHDCDAKLLEYPRFLIDFCLFKAAPGV